MNVQPLNQSRGLMPFGSRRVGAPMRPHRGNRSARRDTVARRLGMTSASTNSWVSSRNFSSRSSWRRSGHCTARSREATRRGLAGSVSRASYGLAAGVPARYGVAGRERPAVAATWAGGRQVDRGCRRWLQSRRLVVSGCGRSASAGEGRAVRACRCYERAAFLAAAAHAARRLQGGAGAGRPPLDQLNLVHGLREAQRRGKGYADRPLWPWSRMTAWRQVKTVMTAAGIPAGPHRTPKGLRQETMSARTACGLPVRGGRGDTPCGFI